MIDQSNEDPQDCFFVCSADESSAKSLRQRVFSKESSGHLKSIVSLTGHRASVAELSSEWLLSKVLKSFSISLMKCFVRATQLRFW